MEKQKEQLHSTLRGIIYLCLFLLAFDTAGLLDTRQIEYLVAWIGAALALILGVSALRTLGTEAN